MMAGKKERSQRRKKLAKHRISDSLDRSRMLTAVDASDKQHESGWEGGVRKIRSDRAELIALAFASLIAGFLVIINLDRLTHVSVDLPEGESRHGWPSVYLTRNFINVPAIYYPSEIYAWPFPPAYNEARRFVWQNLLINIAVCGAIVGASYFFLCRIVRIYDRCRYGQKS